MLEQGCTQNTTEKNEIYDDENGTHNVDVKISRYVQDKSKIRSQFMQRFLF